MLLDISIIEFFQLFDRAWMQRILVTAILIGFVGGIIGTFIILNRVIFLGEAIAHSAFAGVGLGLVIGIDPLFMIFLFSELSAFSVGYVNQKKIMNEDIILAIIFSGMMALGIIFIHFLTEVSASVSSILFGAILYVNSRQVLILLIVSIIVIVLMLFFRKEYFFMVFDEDIAKISGIPTKLLNYLFLGLLAALIAVSIQSIGAILVFALFIIPSASSYMLTYNYKRMIIYSSMFGAFSGFFGIMISFLFNLPGGPSIVLVAVLIFLICYGASPKRLTKFINKIKYKYSSKYKTMQEELDHPFGIDVPHVHEGEYEILLQVKKKNFPQDHIWTGHRLLHEKHDSSRKSDSGKEPDKEGGNK